MKGSRMEQGGLTGWRKSWEWLARSAPAMGETAWSHRCSAVQLVRPELRSNETANRARCLSFGGPHH